MTSRLITALIGIDAVVAAGAVIFFLIGLADGSVSSFNMGLWTGMLAALAITLGGGLWLKKAGHPRFATLLLLIPAVPGLVYGLFVLLILFSDTRWN